MLTDLQKSHARRISRRFVIRELRAVDICARRDKDVKKVLSTLSDIDDCVPVDDVDLKELVSLIPLCRLPSETDIVLVKQWYDEVC